jgi:hypothetical protein
MFIYMIWKKSCGNRVYLFNLWIKRLAGFTRLVFLDLRAWRIFVVARVFFILCACATLGAAEQSLILGTVLLARNPDSQRQRRLTLPVLGLRLHTSLCSSINSLALI